MANWKIEITGKNIRRVSVDKFVESLKERFENSSIRVSDNTPPESRAERFAAALSQIEEAKTEIESLKEELENWKDNLPENLQDGDKAQELDETISELEEIISEAEELASKEVNFPAMF